MGATFGLSIWLSSTVIRTVPRASCGSGLLRADARFASRGACPQAGSEQSLSRRSWSQDQDAPLILCTHSNDPPDAG
jgi:hypothetical protein